MTVVLIILYMAITSRMAGGGLGAKHLDRFKLTWLPELLFAMPFGVYAAMVTPTAGWAAGIVGVAWSYIWMQTGHGTVLQWGKDPAYAQGERVQTLTPVVNWIAKRMGLTIGGVGYCRLFMAVKGFLIGLPVGGLPLALLWPLGYEIGNRLKKHEISELASGAGAGVAITLFMAVT